MSEYFYYIEENLEKIKNPNDVNVILSSTIKNRRRLCASLNNVGGGLVDLFEPIRFAYPAQPIYQLTHEVGRQYWKGFGMIGEHIAINKNHLTGLQYVDLYEINGKEKRVEMYANFDDGKRVYLAAPRRKFFYAEYREQIEDEFNMQFEDLTDICNSKNGLNQ